MKSFRNVSPFVLRGVWTFALLPTEQERFHRGVTMKKAIVIPSYRAEKTLPFVLPRIPKPFWEDGVAIVVNDKSPDRTGEVAESLRKRVAGARRRAPRIQPGIWWRAKNRP